jgi:hypothetical protein
MGMAAQLRSGILTNATAETLTEAFAVYSGIVVPLP